MIERRDPEGPLVGATLGPYRVTGRIGAGGMGVVYRAEDLRLGRTVAVKALPEATEADEVARRKLINEARRASRVVSPYVATVFDVVEQDERAYIVMEYIEGRRLDHVLREDRPGLATVTGCAIEIAEALAAIHAAGLVHRDLKPSNVMLTPAGHVKVMDFGLARNDAAAMLRATADTQVTTQSEGGVAGTVLYMSPEQLRGEPLDRRSDLFSFGTLLFEALTGAHPFERGSIMASASAILKEAPPSGPSAPKLPSSPVSTIVERLLEKDRERRYASAELVLNDLRSAAAGGSISTPPAQGSRSRPLVRLGVAVAVGALALATYLLWPSRPPATDAKAARPTIAVLPFEDRTGEPRGDLRAELLSELIVAELADSTLVRAISVDRVRDILRPAATDPPRLASIAAVAKASDVRWVVAGSLYKEADSLYALIGIYRPGVPEPVETFRSTAGTPAALAELASATMRERLFPGRKDDSSNNTGAGTGSVSEEALLLQQAAKRDLRDLRYREAIEKLEKAVRLDPAFLSAQIRLAEALDLAGFATQAREIADRAVRTLDQSGGSDRNGTLACDARAIHGRAHADAEEEIGARRSLTALHGDDPEAHLGLARALDSRGRSAEALPEVDLAIALDAKDPRAHLARARMLVKAKRDEEAAAALDRADALFTDAGSAAGKASVTRARGDAAYARARYAEAEPFYQTAARDFATAGLPVLAANARKGAGDCELMQGNLDAAVAIYEPVLAAARAGGDHRMIVNTLSSLGGQYLVRGHREEAERVLREARQEASGLGNPRILARPTINLASVLGASDRKGESRALAEEALSIARETGEYEIQAKSLLLIANVSYAEGRPGDAIRAYRDVLESEPLAKAPGTPLGNVHLGLASIYWETGKLKEAKESAEQAVSVNRAAGQRTLLGFSLLARAKISTDLMLEGSASADLDEAARIADDKKAPLADLARRIELTRAQKDVLGGRPDDAEHRLAKLREEAGPTREPGVDAAVFELSATAANDRNKNDDAIRFARRAIADPSVSAIDRVGSRVELARGLAKTGDREGALSEGQRGLDESERIGLPIQSAEACALLVGLGGVGEAGLRSRGQAAIERFLDGAPEDRRDALRRRQDIARVTNALSGKHS